MTVGTLLTLMPRRLRGRVLLGTYFDQDVTRRVPWVSGACHAIPRRAWDQIGVLTEDTFCGFDDYDYCFRAKNHGYEVWLDASSEVLHDCGVAVHLRWKRPEVERLAIHNTYVVLGGHWPRWRIKVHQLAEFLITATELMQVLTPSRRRADPDHAERVLLRLELLGALITGRKTPVHRCQA